MPCDVVTSVAFFLKPDCASHQPRAVKESVSELTCGLGQSPNGLLIFNTGALWRTFYTPAKTVRNVLYH